MMYLAGVVFALIGWAFQLWETLYKKTRNVNIVLPFAYFCACVLFAVDSFMQGDALPAIIDVVLAVISAVIFIILLTRKK
jgi:hypothetical protein